MVLPTQMESFRPDPDLVAHFSSVPSVPDADAGGGPASHPPCHAVQQGCFAVIGQWRCCEGQPSRERPPWGELGRGGARCRGRMLVRGWRAGDGREGGARCVRWGFGDGGVGLEVRER